MDISRHLLAAADKNQTSLGNHPAFPPVDENRFVPLMMKRYFGSITKDLDMEPSKMKSEMSGMLTRCRELEQNSYEPLAKACYDFITRTFDIPEGYIEFELNIGSMADVSQQRMFSEEDGDYSFEDIDDMHRLTGEVYKRRMLDALLCGVATMYATGMKRYATDICDINAELLPLYAKIMKYNHILLFTEKDTLDNGSKEKPGAVKVYVTGDEEPVKIEAEGIIFPVLVFEAVKGLLELSISHGLPKDMETAKYVVSRSDFSLAEPWDMRLGCILWEQLRKCSDDRLDGKEPHFLMELAELPCEDFNRSLQNMLAMTMSGKSRMSEILDGIESQCEHDDFDQFIKGRQGDGEQQLDDSKECYFDPDELLTEIEMQV